MENGLRKIAILTPKGGVGKTTTAINLAHGLALLKYKTLLIDTDTQGHCAISLKAAPAFGLAEVLLEQKGINDALFQARENLYLLAGGQRMANARRRINAEDPLQMMQYLKNTLKPVEKQFDFILIDNAPSWDELSVNVLFFATEILSPVSMEALSLNSLGEFIKRLHTAGEAGAPAKLRYVLPTFIDHRVRKTDAVYKQLQKHFAGYLCNGIRYNSALSEATAYGQSIFEYNPKSKGAQDYKQLIREILTDGKK